MQVELRNAIGCQFGTEKLGETGHEKFHEFAQAEFPLCTPAAVRDQALWWEKSTRCLQSKTGVPVATVLLGNSHREHLYIGPAKSLPKGNIASYIRGVIISARWLHRGGPARALKATVEMLPQACKRVAIIDDVPDYLFDPSTCQHDRAFRSNKRSQKRRNLDTRRQPNFDSGRKLARPQWFEIRPSH